MKPLKHKYSQTALYVVLLAAVIVLMGLTRRCDSSPLLPRLKEGNSGGDTLDVAMIYGPMSYYVYADTLGGMNYDMLRQFATDENLNIKMWPVVNLHDALRQLEDGTYDMLASLPSDNSVKQRFATTESVFLDRLVLLQKKDSLGNIRIRSALDLAGDTIHIQHDSPAASRLANLSNEIGARIEIVSEKDLSEEYLCMKVAKGDFPLAVVNEKTASSMSGRYPDLCFDNPVSFTQFQVWVTAKGDTALRNRADRWLGNFKDTPTYRKLLSRY